jgi:hypothetical protein
MTEKDIYKHVLNDCCRAYCDCNNKFSYRERDLSFSASHFLSVEEAVSILEEALSKDENTIPSYNNFVPGLLMNLPKGTLVKVAREGSVCVYVKNTGFSLEEMQSIASQFMEVDEVDISNVAPNSTVYRLWWD